MPGIKSFPFTHSFFKRDVLPRTGEPILPGGIGGKFVLGELEGLAFSRLVRKGQTKEEDGERW